MVFLAMRRLSEMGSAIGGWGCGKVQPDCGPFRKGWAVGWALFRWGWLFFAEEAGVDWGAPFEAGAGVEEDAVDH